MNIRNIVLVIVALIGIFELNFVFGVKYVSPICKANPKGISSFRPADGTRLYYAWSTIQGTAKKSFMSNTLCRGGDISDCSCLGYDVTGYDKKSGDQEGFTFSVNKRLGVGDLYHFKRQWLNSPRGNFYLECTYDTDFEYGNSSSYDKKSYTTIWNQPNVNFKSINKLSNKLKVLSWTAKEVVFYDCNSVDHDIRLYTTYIPTSKNKIPFSVFDILSEVGININTLRWLKLDHKKCQYPNYNQYEQLLKKISKPIYK